MGRIPSQRLFNVIGTFAANSEVDGNEMLVNIEDASRLMRYPAGNITGVGVCLCCRATGAGAVVDQAAGEAEEQGSERGLWHATLFPKRSGQANERV